MQEEYRRQHTEDSSDLTQSRKDGRAEINQDTDGHRYMQIFA